MARDAHDVELRDGDRVSKQDGYGTEGVMVGVDPNSSMTGKWQRVVIQWNDGRRETLPGGSVVKMSALSRCPGCNAAAPVTFGRVEAHRNARTGVTCAGTGHVFGGGRGSMVAMALDPSALRPGSRIRSHVGGNVGEVVAVKDAGNGVYGIDVQWPDAVHVAFIPRGVFHMYSPA